MSKEFTYEFGGHPTSYYYNGGEHSDWEGTEEFIYVANDNEAEEYIRRTHSIDEILEDYIKSGAYVLESDEYKENLKEIGFDGSIQSIANMNEEDKKDLVNDVLFEILFIDDYYDDELKDYFEQDAYDQWAEQ